MPPKTKTLLFVTSMYYYTLLLLVCWSKSVWQVAKAGFREQRVPVGICACAQKQYLEAEAEFFIPMSCFFFFNVIFFLTLLLHCLPGPIGINDWGICCKVDGRKT